MSEDIRKKIVQYNDWTGVASADGHTNFEIYEALGVGREWFIVYVDLILYSRVQGVRAWGIKGSYEDLEAQAREGRIEVTRIADISFEVAEPSGHNSAAVSAGEFISRVFERLIVGLEWSQKSLRDFEPYEMVEVASIVDDD